MNPSQAMAHEGTEPVVGTAGSGAAAPDLQVVGRSAPRKDAHETSYLRARGRARLTKLSVMVGIARRSRRPRASVAPTITHVFKNMFLQARSVARGRAAPGR